MILKIVRWCVLTFTLVFAIVVLGISGHLIAIRPTNYWRFAALAIAVSSLTILTFPVILIVNTLLVRDENISPERVIGEIGWVVVMWILWLATGANATHAARVHFFSGGCSHFSGYSNQICNEFRVVEAFAWIIFIILFCYFIGLLVYLFTRDMSQDGRTRQPDTENTGAQTRQVKAPATTGQQ
ncbi:hypothetical protein BD769DRAFT_1672919 [Suillus cothurnatus]|jgi:hypothetical protein|nr:hypothetical protein BD769DRAFT_1672919 [Suillus cothurnatus]